MVNSASACTSLMTLYSVNSMSGIYRLTAYHRLSSGWFIMQVCVCDGFAPCSPHGFMAYEGTCAREPPGTHASSLGNHLAASEAKPVSIEHCCCSV